ncbi:MAG: Molybdenum ABC transporter permease protein [Candidatus Tokpelaia hoelldobleri]|uniref:Molybdenum transport system permease n=1 Tax=Candidatus Tokpelaia hoelldobleri TaxID=1902579 RepID=A0A1U9JWV7_9HYPH|nr:MAG: Molybdenum ABC transporter permease protein [Candidatus Tokpelaia hoelldoblerii]
MNILSASTLAAIWLTLELAFAATACLLLIGIPLAWWLARTRLRLREVITALVALPLVLPPTVLGFYLLVALGPNGAIGWLAPLFGMRTFAFSFAGLLIGSVVYSLPFVVQPVRNAFAAIGARPLEVAATLRQSPWQSFFKVALPLARPGILTGAVLAFAHTVGEYGIVVMIGGNTPQTRVISTTIVQLNENQRYTEAAVLSAIMLVFAFVVILTVSLLERQKKRETML